jgi:hypothetical protein
METPTNLPEALVPEEEDDTCELVRATPEEPVPEQGSGRDEDSAIGEYERLQQENVRQNELKLQELGVPLLAQKLVNPNATRTTPAGGGEGTRRAGASSIGNRHRDPSR